MGSFFASHSIVFSKTCFLRARTIVYLVLWPTVFSVQRFFSFSLTNYKTSNVTPPDCPGFLNLGELPCHFGTERPKHSKMGTYLTGEKLTLCLLLFILGTTNALECYVCTRQEGNKEKCLTTTKTCESWENACQSEIRWGSTPYWSQGAEKQYYVTKRCARKEDCEQYVSRFTPYCHRIWYEDWKCGECCQGDRCNYFIVMGAGNLKINSWTVMLSAVMTTALGLFFR